MSEATAASNPAAAASGEPETSRIVTLDIVRGIAVMGILAMNIVLFAMPEEAQTDPRAYGWTGQADIISWFVSFVLIEGKMRGLFSLLFGASMLLMIDRTEARGLSSARAHFSRMSWLLAFGLVHYYFIWRGDILSLYAPLGMAAWLFRNRPTEQLVGAGLALIMAQFLIFSGSAMIVDTMSIAGSAPGAGTKAVETWRSLSEAFAIPDAEQIARGLALYRGSYTGIVAHQLTEGLWDPLYTLWFFGLETLGYMLLGMAGLRAGFLDGSWKDRDYARTAAAGFAIAIPIYAWTAVELLRANFGPVAVLGHYYAAGTALRPIMIIAYAALIILATRHGGAFVERIAAAGRAAFTNYLGTSVLMVCLFYGFGFGLFGTLSRAQLWLVVIPMWALMLLWSKFWLDRYRYGPLEWLWRSLARGRVEPMRKA